MKYDYQLCKDTRQICTGGHYCLRIAFNGLILETVPDHPLDKYCATQSAVQSPGKCSDWLEIDSWIVVWHVIINCCLAGSSIQL
ncbi:hypothetical protein TSUD_350350 [Trifolium subterraneum]|uniref:Uncharacterized protein n=1 Tax=Trifolium subterraneum TaxID=3900 RepID=A0A2Z6PCH3_TRISU|nr:hypothetical protein TSUD_350350 [Trifolium subterraneum]